MTRFLLAKMSALLIPALASLNLSAQKTEEGFDASFRPSTGVARYYVVTEEKDGRWYREAYYLQEKSFAMMAWYKDKECKIPDGETSWYWPTKTLKYKGKYLNGKKDGTWIQFHENGMISDSSFYVNGHLKGVSLGWNNEGYQVDSSFYDGQGNGTEVHWFPGGPVSSAGYIENDTSKAKRWNYYYPNGQLLATEDYVKGKRTTCNCFTETGQRRDSCSEKEAYFPGEEIGWRKYLERNLNPNVPVKKGAPEGKYTIMVQFVVNADGKLSDMKPLTKFGFGMEEEVLRLLKASPKWIPAVQFGRNVKAYRKQPVTFMVTKG